MWLLSRDGLTCANCGLARTQKISLGAGKGIAGTRGARRVDHDQHSRVTWWFRNHLRGRQPGKPGKCRKGESDGPRQFQGVLPEHHKRRINKAFMRVAKHAKTDLVVRAEHDWDGVRAII